MEKCELCNREVELTEHYLVPKCLHNDKWFKKRYSKVNMRSGKISICYDCHGFLHSHFKFKDLGKNLNTVESLLKNEVVIKFTNWIKKR